MHSFCNFKNFRKAEINLFSSLTILIGKNGGGKSNIIEGIEMLAALAGGTPIYDLIENSSSDSASIIRGGVHACPFFNEKSFTLGFSGGINFLGKYENFKYEISISTQGIPGLLKEYLKVGDRFFFSAEREENSEIMTVRYDNFARGGTKPHKNLVGDRSIISRYNELIESNLKGDGNKKISALGVVSGIMKHLKSSFIFDPNPKMMRDYVRSGQSQLNKYGSNISAVLYNLQTSKNDDHQKTLQRILDVIQQVPEEPFGEFKFITTTQNDVLFGFALSQKPTLGSEEKVIDARLISDGTLRAIAVITALETMKPDSRVVIEEFDNGLHPSRADLLLKSIVDIVNRRRLNVLLTTHNPATLDAIDNSILSDVVVCYWSADEQSAKITKLLDIPNVDTLLEAKDGLGDLVTKSLFETHLAPRFTENKKAKALALIKRLK